MFDYTTDHLFSLYFVAVFVGGEVTIDRLVVGGPDERVGVFVFANRREAGDFVEALSGLVPTEENIEAAKASVARKRALRTAAKNLHLPSARSAAMIAGA